MNIPNNMKEIYETCEEIISKFCDENLNEEYKKVCLYVLAKLCRKRPSPMNYGKLTTWACGIIYAVGSVNFLYDKKSGNVYMSQSDICEYFNISISTAGAKSKTIRDLIKMYQFCEEYAIDSLLPEIYKMNEYNYRLNCLFNQ